MRFKDKVVIVTGSSRGIGKAAAMAFSREGAKVVITSRKKKDCEQAAREIGANKCLVVECDVSKAKDVENLVKQTLKKFGKIDIIVNNAGILTIKPIGKTTDKDWDDEVSINLKGQFLLCRAAIPHLKNGSVIVNVSSALGEAGAADVSAYCASKGGVIALTKALAVEFAPRNIRVNTVAPGPISTAMMASVEKNPQFKKEVLDWVPLGRFGKPEEVAQAILFLASSDASYITGHVLNVDGGALAW